MPSLEGVWRTAVRAAELLTLLLLGGRGCPLVTVANGPLMARRSWWSWSAHGSGGGRPHLSNLCTLPAWTRSLISQRLRPFRAYSGSWILPP